MHKIPFIANMQMLQIYMRFPYRMLQIYMRFPYKTRHIYIYNSLIKCYLWILDFLSQLFSTNFPINKGNQSYFSIPSKDGIQNYGNTCYLNSVLQILASTPEFSDCLIPDSDFSKTLLSIMRMVNRNSHANFKPKIDFLLKLIYRAYSNVFSI
ncbi:unnamed protein product [Blepharisma stoltei]|uniref:USP domain-containing protein n=1 Tax=Blepharisma stoltei TaxID=1481888 RepID=A0AAU9ICI0_9CILI|nr:unnamed protein product [Blepharisma stoltei]